jgi:hypothetical protein
MTVVPGAAPVAPGGKIVAVCIYESADVVHWPSAKVAAFNSLAVDRYLKAHGSPGLYRWDKDRVSRTGQPPKQCAPFLERAKGRPLPWLIVAAQSGRVLYDGPFPENEAAEKAILTKAGGK